MKKLLIPKELCSRCGLCFALDQDGWTTKDAQGYPVVDSKISGEKRSQLLRFCAGIELKYPKLLANVHGSDYVFNPETPDVGHLRSVGIAYAADPEFREMGQSGGISISLLRAGLKLGFVDSCLAVRRPHQGAGDIFGAEPYISKNEADLREAAGSKYAVSPSLELLEKVESESRIGYIATLLPCQTNSMRRYLSDKHDSKCRLIIGPFCGLNMDASMGREVASKLGLDPNRVRRFGNRSGAFPGQTTFENEDGSRVYLDRTAHRAFYRAYAPERCYTCTDYGNELADVTIADAFLKKPGVNGMEWTYPEGAGYLVIRTKRGEEFVKRAVEAGLLIYEPMEVRQFEERWENSFVHRKIRAYNRIHQFKREGLAVPNLGYRLPDFTEKYRFADEVDRFLVRVLYYKKELRSVFLSIWLAIVGRQRNPLFNVAYLLLKHNLFTHIARDVSLTGVFRKIWGKLK